MNPHVLGLKSQRLLYRIIVHFTLLLAATNLWSDVKTSDQPQAQHILKLNNILVDKVKKEIRIRAKLAITQGILEYLLVGNHGKTYESVFKVDDSKPSELNFALLLIGSKAMDFDEFLELKNGDNGPAILSANHRQSLLEIDLLREGKKFDLQRLVTDREKSGQPFIWVYTGGFLIKDHGYAADLDLSYIGIWSDRLAVINLFSDLKNPYRGDFGYEMNQAFEEELEVDQNFEIIIRRPE